MFIFQEAIVLLATIFLLAYLADLFFKSRRSKRDTENVKDCFMEAVKSIKEVDYGNSQDLELDLEPPEWEGKILDGSLIQEYPGFKTYDCNCVFVKVKQKEPYSTKSNKWTMVYNQRCYVHGDKADCDVITVLKRLKDEDLLDIPKGTGSESVG